MAVLSKTIEPPPHPVRPSHAHNNTLHRYFGGADQDIEPANYVPGNYNHEQTHGPFYNIPGVKRSEQARAQVSRLRLERVRVRFAG